jgi:DNA-binding transcriptional ArsR family regulator
MDGLVMNGQIMEEISEKSAARMAELFRALSDTSRVRILIELLHQERNVGTLAERVGISESATSHHLRNLRLLHLVRARKEGRQVFYRLDDDHVSELIKNGLDHVQHG